MLGIDTRVLKTVWTVFLFVLAVLVIYQIRGALVTFTLAIFLALLLSPVVTYVDHFTSVRVPRAVSLAVVYIALLGAIVAIVIAVGSGIAGDARALSAKFPAALQGNPLSQLPLPAWLEPMREQLGGWLHAHLDELGRNAVSLGGEAMQQLVTGLGALVTFVLVPILAFFFILEGRHLTAAFIRSFETHKQFLVHGILYDLQKLLSHYLRSLLILASVTFLCYSGFLALTGSRSAILLGGLAGVMEFVPAAGPLVAIAVIVLVGLISGYAHWILLIVFVMLYRLALDYGLQPALLSSGMELHPLLVIFGVVAGGEIGGVMGVFLSVPVIAALRLILQRLWTKPGKNGDSVHVSPAG